MAPWPHPGGVDHTPTVAADERALRLLERVEVPAPHRERLMALVRAAQASAEESGAEIQAEFGREHVGLIVGCNQFLRVYRSGQEPGAVELLLDQGDKQTLAGAGFSLREPEGAVFKLFGWIRIDPMQGDAAALDAATRHAFRKAQGAKKPK